MNIDFHFSSTDSVYLIKSVALKYEIQVPALVTTFREFGSKTELILAIGEGKERIQNDPEYSAACQKGEIIFSNPFSISTFHPKFAESVIYHYLIKIHETKRKNTKELFRTVLHILRVDKFNVILKILQYNFIDEEKRKVFEKSLSAGSMTRNFQIEGAI